MKKFYLLIVITSFCALNSSAQMVKLDSLFNATGIATFGTMLKHKDACESSVLQPDGKILMCGWTFDGDTSLDMLIVRVLGDGTIDSTFGIGGYVQADYNGNCEKALAITLQEDGRIIIAGQEYVWTNSSKFDFVVLRLLPDGTPDSTFGNAGWVITDLGSEYEFIKAVAVQEDGKIIAAGRVEITMGPGAGNADFAMVRYLQDGTLDPEFGNSGFVQTTFLNSPFTYDEAHSLAVLPSGKILLGGMANHQIFALSRYNLNGSLDSTFGENGLITTDVGGENQSEVITDIKLLEDGRFVVSGPIKNVIYPWENDIGLARYLPNGDLDHEFGHNGIALTSIGPRSSINDFVLMPDGRILLCGSTNIEIKTVDSWLLARLLEDGKLDTTFGAGGYITLQMGGQSAYNVFIQPDSSIMLTGRAAFSLDDDYDFAAARFITDKTSSLADHPSENNLHITPNPSSGTFWINLDSDISSELHIVIYDLFGRSVFSSVMNENSTGQLELSLPNIYEGCYILQVSDKNSRWVKKIIVQK